MGKVENAFPQDLGEKSCFHRSNGLIMPFSSSEKPSSASFWEFEPEIPGNKDPTPQLFSALYKLLASVATFDRGSRARSERRSTGGRYYRPVSTFQASV